MGHHWREKRTSPNSTSLTPKPLASSVYVHVPEAPSPHKRSISVTSFLPFPCFSGESRLIGRSVRNGPGDLFPVYPALDDHLSA